MNFPVNLAKDSFQIGVVDIVDGVHGGLFVTPEVLAGLCLVPEYEILPTGKIEVHSFALVPRDRVNTEKPA